MRDTLRPSLADISFKIGMLTDVDVEVLDEITFRTLMMLVKWCATSQVWTYSEPSDGRLPYCDDATLARVARVHIRTWKRLKPKIAQFFDINEQGWALNRKWIEIGGEGTQRPAIPAGLRSAVLQRDNYRCGYCGASEGPFHLDHIVAVARGGATAIENLLTACAPCNLSKSDKTIEEWIRSRTLAPLLREPT